MSTEVKHDQEKQGKTATRGQHARRFARVGMLLGAVVGLGGGLGGVLKMALLGAIGGAVAGGMAGEKLSPLADKIGGFLPGKRRKQAEAAAVPVQEKVQAKAAPETVQYQDLGSIDPQVLAELRDGVSGAVTKLKAASIAEAGMLKEGEVAQSGGWVDAVSNKRPTHPAHLTYQ